MRSVPAEVTVCSRGFRCARVLASYRAGKHLLRRKPLSSRTPLAAATWRQPKWAAGASACVVRPLQPSVHERKPATRPDLDVVVAPQILVRASRDRPGVAFAHVRHFTRAKRASTCAQLAVRN